MWFCAHAIFYFKLMDAEQESFLVHENIYLVGADDAASAAEIAKQLAKANEDTNENGHLELNERKTAYLFAGLRKIVEVEHPNSERPNELSGLEVSYSVFEVDTLEEVFSLARSEMVNVLYRE
jgi:Domain of unknown function (DUF4288)